MTKTDIIRQRNDFSLFNSMKTSTAKNLLYLILYSLKEHTYEYSLSYHEIISVLNIDKIDKKRLEKTVDEIFQPITIKQSDNTYIKCSLLSYIIYDMFWFHYINI